MKIVWSYSSIKTFDQCAKKYYHLRVAKDTEDKGTEATLYGQEMHKVAEDFIRERKPIPPKFNYIQEALQILADIPGEKLCEKKLGVKLVNGEYHPCDFFDKDVWWRGIIDLLILDGDKAYLVDYKTSKNAKYADTKQLDLMAAAVFLHYPQVQTIKSALAFVVSVELVKKMHRVAERDSYMQVFRTQLERLEAAHESGVWNAVTGPLCKFCPVKTCEHNRGK
jgi:ATP-dependent exoDNAse (exonuclease V) beta subunit